MIRGPFAVHISADASQAVESLHRCSSAFCRHMHDVVWAQRHRASRHPFLTWALVIFLAGTVFGAVLSTAFAAEGRGSVPAPWTPELELVVEGTATATVVEGGRDVAAAMSMTTLRAAVLGGEAPPSVVDVLPATSTPDPHTVVTVLRAAAAEFGVDADELVRVALCESSLNGDSVGLAQEVGLMQFLPRTFAANAKRLGYSIRDIGDDVAQARVAAEMWSREQQWQWTCAR